jgi:hypothetical protein
MGMALRETCVKTLEANVKVTYTQEFSTLDVLFVLLDFSLCKVARARDAIL